LWTTTATLAGGEPAPGTNGVIAWAAMEASKCGLRPIGIYDGYRDLAAGRTPKTGGRTLDRVSRIHTSGGAILRTARTNPAKDEAMLQRCVDALGALDICYLVCIGGDDTTFGATNCADRTRGRIGVATVPKTIDNDLPLPGSTPTFGFETARQVGVGIIRNLAEDARTTSRWYLIVSMGRAAGHLALGIGKASASTVTIIPEEFRGRKITLDEVCDIILGAVIKRASRSRAHGVVVLAEGLLEAIGQEGLASMMSNGPRSARFVSTLASVPGLTFANAAWKSGRPAPGTE